MTREEQIKPLIEQGGLFEFLDIHSVNHRPHPFMVGPQHVAAAQKYGGMLGEPVLKEVPCAHPGCRLSYEDHTSDTVAFLKLKRNVENKEAGEVLGDPTLKKIMTLHKVDGYCFVDTPEKFRIQPAKEE